MKVVNKIEHYPVVIYQSSKWNVRGLFSISLFKCLKCVLRIFVEYIFYTLTALEWNIIIFSISLLSFALKKIFKIFLFLCFCFVFLLGIFNLKSRIWKHRHSINKRTQRHRHFYVQKFIENRRHHTINTTSKIQTQNHTYRETKNMK